MVLHTSRGWLEKARIPGVVRPRLTIRTRDWGTMDTLAHVLWCPHEWVIPRSNSCVTLNHSTAVGVLWEAGIRPCGRISHRARMRVLLGQTPGAGEGGRGSCSYPARRGPDDHLYRSKSRCRSSRARKRPRTLGGSFEGCNPRRKIPERSHAVVLSCPRHRQR